MKKRLYLSATQTIAAGFAVIIILGSLLLMLPVSSRNGEAIPFLNALFTSTSATCVTGLVIYDTWTQFSLFGQIVILMLIQIGGLGFMTIAILFSMIIGKRIGLKERSLIMETVSSMQLGGVVKLVKLILIGTLIFECAGAAVLFTKFSPMFGASRGLWFAIFHSVSAFCNAGFDLMGIFSPFVSLTAYARDVTVNITIMGLVVVGGIGFIVWDDIARNKWHIKKYNLHTKVVLAFSAVLIVIPAILFIILERNNLFSTMNSGEMIMASLFQSVTTRTAGFNTIEIAGLSDGSVLLTNILMFIGAAPGSTGGGAKITTFAVILISVKATAMRHEDVNIFSRRLDKELVNKAFSKSAFYLMLALLGCILLMMLQQAGLKDAITEVFSAIGTVGLSAGMTRDLELVPKLIIIALMYSGRIGSLTIFMAVSGRIHSQNLKNPVEKLIIG